MARLPIQSSRGSTVVIDGRELDYFGGCGYLGLAQHPRVIEALVAGAQRHGVSSGAARETTGNALVHDELERDLVRCLGCAAAVLTPEGATANLAAAQALAHEYDFALIDEKSHPSLFDAAQAADFEVRSFAHADTRALEAELQRAGKQRVVVMTDSVFPSRGEIAPLAEWSRLVAQRAGALLVDDCHGTGVIGPHGLGALEHGELAGSHVVLTSTLSKALGCYGGFVAGDTKWIELVRTRSNAYLGTTPVPPAIAEAARVALEIAFGSPERIGRLRANIALMRSGLERLGMPTPREELPVFAFQRGDAQAMKSLEALLRDAGVLAPYIRYPGGPPEGFFRIVVNAAHSLGQIERLIELLERHAGGAR